MLKKVASIVHGLFEVLIVGKGNPRKNGCKWYTQRVKGTHSLRMNTIASFMSDDKALLIFLFITIILARAADISIHCATKGTFHLDHKKLSC